MTSAVDLTTVPGLGDWASFMDESEQALAHMLVANGQTHLFSAWKAGEDVAAKHAFFEQVRGLERGYPGGVAQYVINARKLLQDSAADANPFEGYTPKVTFVLFVGLSSGEANRSRPTRQLLGADQWFFVSFFGCCLVGGYFEFRTATRLHIRQSRPRRGAAAETHVFYILFCYMYDCVHHGSRVSL